MMHPPAEMLCLASEYNDNARPLGTPKISLSSPPPIESYESDKV